MTATQITHGLWLGDTKDAQSFQGYVLCVMNTRPEDEPEHAEHRSVMVSGKPDMTFIDQAITALYEAKARNANVLLHCENGNQISAMVMAAYLMKYNSMTIEKAFEFLKERRASIELKKSLT